MKLKLWILILITISLISPYLTIEKVNRISGSTTSHLVSNYYLVEHEAITIINDGNFTDYGFAGNGTSDSPFLIENLNITTSKAKAISIEHTKLHFTLRNCYLAASGYGIFIFNTSRGTVDIQNNFCMNHSGYGISVRDSQEATIQNNTCSYNSDYGIFVSSSSQFSIVKNNSCEYNGIGIQVESSPTSDLSAEVTIIENTCINNRIGMNIRTSMSVNISSVYRNICNYNGIGIYFSHAEDTNVENNTCTKNDYSGIYLAYSIDISVVSNLCNSNYLHGIYLKECLRVKIFQNYVYNCQTGIYVIGAEDLILEENVCVENRADGIFLEMSIRATLSNNTCNYNNLHGISLITSAFAILTSNICSMNLYGIEFVDSPTSIITNNTCRDNSKRGIQLSFSEYCILSYNNIQANGEYGLVLRLYSDHCIIHHNFFAANNLEGTSQAFDDCFNCTWYEEETNEGNTWSEWDSRKPYLIDGAAESEDLYPLNEEMERISLSFISILPMVVLILLKIKTKNKRKGDKDE